MRLELAATIFLTTLSLGCGSEEVVWPIANSAESDADQVSAPFGPRDQSGSYDFHAGIDFPVPEGTKVRAIKAGTVEKTVEWNGQTGPGNWVLIDHGGGEKSAYLHLSKISVDAGDTVNAGTTLGRSGSTGSSSEHLHMNYMLGVEHKGADESLAHNPLELLPHADMPTPGVEFNGNAVVLDIPDHPMTIQAITLEGGGESRTVDYADVVAVGNPDRDTQTQFGLHLEIGESDPGRFTLTLRPSPANFTPERVIVEDYAGELVLDEKR
ncbi:Glycyl-glycine endopeptidase ALE-1 precursor [Enhygromyxa salina]|uniref:Glycyl-glycine endopeptidase ALE-1 n=1 Tax=Enhygromyxa salina TaxID=215803 RepID=A0A2S9XJX8_9BACT|nr:M23 family metallopeptidase [Enhygromyxa salina]PRP93165.1 Glycyl-glycine endopeptidase ALE-1 precursor [Enhygromyxa salina]